MTKPSVLVLGASLREGSDNRKLATVIGRMLTETGWDANVMTLRDFDMPLYDQDILDKSGMPPGGERLVATVRDASAIIIATPEYNYSIPGVLKNAFDWTSRARPMPWKGKPVLLTAASPSTFGGIRGLWQARVPFEGCLAHVYPDMFALSESMNAFTGAQSSVDLKDAEVKKRLQSLLADFTRFIQKLRGE